MSDVKVSSSQNPSAQKRSAGAGAKKQPVKKSAPKRAKKPKDPCPVPLIILDILLIGVIICAGLLWKSYLGEMDAEPESVYAAQMRIEEQRELQIQQETREKQEYIAYRNEESKANYETANLNLDSANALYLEAVARRDEAQAQLDDLQEQIDYIKSWEERTEQLLVDYGTACRLLEDMILAGKSDYRIVYLTFDDGPSYYTNRFIKELARLDVYASFFTIGCQMSTKDYSLRDEYLRGEAMGGHSICNHTFSHAFSTTLYRSVDSFITQVEKQDEVVYNATGLHTHIVRFPAGSYYCTYRKGSIAALEEKGMGWVDWVGNVYDSGGTTYTASTTAWFAIRQCRQEKVIVVLCHDWKLQTLGALDKIVTTLSAENRVFLPLFQQSSMIGTAYPKWD